jgi:hypothetical protein
MRQQQSAVIAILLLGALAGCQRSTAPARLTGIRVGISPGGGGLRQCDNIQLTADVQDLSGRFVRTDSVRWTSSDTTAAPVSADGLVRALHTSPAVTIRVVAYRDEIQGSAQVIFFITSDLLGFACPPQ